jgi:drug/metabolite transporter (DMT)-like permease
MPLVVLLYALFASVFTISKVGLYYTEPFFFVGSRMVMAGVLMLGYQYFVKKETFNWSGAGALCLLKLSFFNIYLTNTCEFLGLKYLTSFKTCFFYSFSPFISALLSYLILSEKMTKKKWIGLIIGFIGLLPIILTQSGAEEKMGTLFYLSWPEIYVITAATASVYGWIMLRQLINEHKVSPMMANGWSMLIGGTLALFHSYFVENWNPFPVTKFVPFFECAIALMIISNLVCYNLYGYLLKRFTATFMSFAGFQTPLFSAFFGWFFLNEVVGFPFFIALAIVFGGLVVFYQEEMREGEMFAKIGRERV